MFDDLIPSDAELNHVHMIYMSLGIHWINIRRIYRLVWLLFPVHQR